MTCQTKRRGPTACSAVAVGSAPPRWRGSPTATGARPTSAGAISVSDSLSWGSHVKKDNYPCPNQTIGVLPRVPRWRLALPPQDSAGRLPRQGSASHPLGLPRFSATCRGGSMPKKVTVLVLDNSSDFRKGTGVVHGGSCNPDSVSARSAVREWTRYHSRWNDLGFRLLVVEDPWAGR